MSGFAIFARKEAVEIPRTWRIWVLPTILLFFAITGPVMARFTPEIVTAFAGDQLGGILIPPSTYLDSYSGWIKNLSQIGLFALIIIYGGIVSAEAKSGTAVLVLTKPVSRASFIVAKVVVQSAFVTLLVAAGTLVTWGLTLIVFGTAPAGPLWSSALVWLVFGILFVAIMTLLSALIDSTSGAAGAGLGVYVLLSIAGIWKPLGDYSPAGLPGQSAALATGAQVDVLWSALTALLLAVVVVALAARVLDRKDL
ncbi:ABC-2 type transport system permease protein [Cryobacterium sp. MP_M5]|uniref:ABC transporter permease n=1 Tax=unclassified Cryobacterium TaxID=2649013 RepID=UPI0018CA5EA7|nr:MULTISPECIES: ABC transporter permease subunit [unclassified Cryobacterium]MBG6060057.1 ABC-2 type transport system permease protein [Cryobacterium sp. MP_M3]MEC5178465.1 ABC-2 type transport system permease protein [Cryobacterium sp. MP_M5]